MSDTLTCMRTTLNLDDELVTEAKILAVRRRTTLTAVIEDALRDVLQRASAPPARIELPVFHGGGFPEGFPFHGSVARMIEFLEGPDAQIP